MHTEKDNVLPAQGTSDPQGPAGGRGTVPAPPPSSSDDGLPRESRVGSRGARTTAPKWWREVLKHLPECEESAEAWDMLLKFNEGKEEMDIDGKIIREMAIFIKELLSLLDDIKIADRKIREEYSGKSQKTPSTSTREIGVGTAPQPKGCDAATQVEENRREKQFPPPKVPTGEKAEKGKGSEKSLPSLIKSGGPPPPLNRDGRPTYAEAMRIPPLGRTSASSSGDCESPSEDIRGRGTRSSKVTIRVPNIGDIGLLGLGTGDLIIMVPGEGEAPQQGGKPLPKREADKGDRPPRARFKRGNGGAKIRGGGVGAEEPASPAAARCYRCLMPGHLAAGCGGPDRRHRCYRCGSDSCRWRRCRSDPPRCPLCMDLGGSSEHMLGAGGCRRLPPERRKRGRRKGGRGSEGPSPSSGSKGGLGSSASGSSS